MLSLIFLMELIVASPSSSNYQGRIFDQNGDPVNSGSVSLQLEVRDPSGKCVLYAESHSSILMEGKSGYISVRIGSGQVLANSPFTFIESFSNRASFANVNMNCPTPPNSNAYSPAALDSRLVRAIVNGETLSPDLKISSSPYSLYANEAGSLDGHSYSDITDYADANLAGTALPNVSAITSGQAIRWSATGWELYNSVTVDNDTLSTLGCANGQMAKFSGGNWVCTNTDNHSLDSQDGSATDAVFVSNSGSVGIGTSTPASAALVDLSSTTKGLLPPRMTEVERDAIATPVAGLLLYNTDTDTLQIHDGTSWANVDSGGGGGGGGGSTCTLPADLLIDGVHDVSDCTAASGTAIAMGVSGCICQLNVSSCPAGWTQYSNWSTTTSKSCTGGGCAPSSCGTGTHGWADISRETCGFTTGGTVPIYGSCGGTSTGTCYANKTQMGCK